mmetsp:Transcript_4363/g.5732  ORF Transcript_4363/g.5732 Transcript_4363/m.5732 type:complete len:156 (+) Transcript_4363:22-489(+)
MPSQKSSDGNAGHGSINHEAVLKRFEEVTSVDYPFQKPEFVKPKDRSEKVNLKSTRNVLPLLKSLFLLLSKIVLPPMVLVFGGLGLYFKTMNGLTSQIFFALSVACSVPVLSDPFFMHFITDGYLGTSALGAGGGQRKPKEGFFCSDTPRNQRIR